VHENISVRRSTHLRRRPCRMHAGVQTKKTYSGTTMAHNSLLIARDQRIFGPTDERRRQSTKLSRGKGAVPCNSPDALFAGTRFRTPTPASDRLWSGFGARLSERRPAHSAAAPSVQNVPPEKILNTSDGRPQGSTATRLRSLHRVLGTSARAQRAAASGIKTVWRQTKTPRQRLNSSMA
jgi:hypothetical protein